MNHSHLRPCALLGPLLLLCISLSGCASYFYDWAQDSRVASCHRLPLGDERVRCEAQAREMSFDRYRAEVEAAKATSGRSSKQ